MAIFLDSGFFIALYNKLDENHQAAKKLMEELLNGAYGKAYTSSFILDEVVSYSLRKLGLEHSIKIEHIIQDSGLVDMLPVGDAFFAEAKIFFKKHPSLELTLTDWTNISIMLLNGIDMILSFDSGFDKLINIKEFAKIRRVH